MRYFILFIFFFLTTTFSFASGYKVKTEWQAHTGGVQNIRFSPDGKMLASCGLKDNAVKIWDSQTGKLLYSLTDHSDMVYEITFSPNSLWLASAGKDGQVCIWETKTGKLIRTLTNEPVYGIGSQVFKSVSFACFSSDNQQIYFGGENSFLYQASINSKAKAQRITQVNTHDKGYIKTITGGALAPDMKSVMVAIDNFVKVVNPQSGEITKTFYYPFDYINDVVAGPNGSQISTWSYDGKVTIWDYKSGKNLKSIQVTAAKNYSTPSFNRNGKLLITSAFGNSARLWDLASSSDLAKLGGHGNIVRTSKFSPTENIIATASYDGTIKIWEEDHSEIPQDIAKKTPSYPTDPKGLTSHKSKPPVYFLGKLVEKDMVIPLEDVKFEKSNHNLTEASKTELLKVVALMEEYPQIKIEIHGHTDNIGHALLNYQLSEKRAQISKNYLVEQGIAAQRISLRAFGESKPSYDNLKDDTRSLNRRIEIKVTKGI